MRIWCIINMTSLVFEIFMKLPQVFWIFMNSCHGYFEYWSYVMGILNIREVTSWVFWIFMKWYHGYFEYIWSYVTWYISKIIMTYLMGILNIHKVTSWVFWIFMNWSYVTSWISKIPMRSLHEYSKYPWRNFSNQYCILNMHVMGALNISGVTLFILKIQEVKRIIWSDVMGLEYLWSDFMMKWPNGYFEYSYSDLMGIMNIHEVTSMVFGYSWMSWVFWISMTDVMRIFNIYEWRQITYDVTSYSKYPWGHSWIFKIYPWHLNIFQIPWRHFMNIQNTRDVTSWIFKIPMW